MERNLTSQGLFEEALTFDDVLLIPSYSKVLPRDVNISTQLTTDLRLNVPIVSAAMDTVTEHALAIAMAKEGGLGFIHKNMSVETQAAQVRNVKRSESGMIIDPVTLSQNALIRDALQLMRTHKIGGTFCEKTNMPSFESGKGCLVGGKYLTHGVSYCVYTDRAKILGFKVNPDL